MALHPRDVRPEDLENPKPIYAVWEITLRCDQGCRHCGSRAGRARMHELDTAEVLDIGRQLLDLGCREVTLIGGELYLRPDALDIIRGLTEIGLYVTTLTGGANMPPERVAAFAEAGVRALSVSIDGMEEVHERLRRVPGGWRRALDVLDAAREVGLPIGVNTQVNQLNLHELREMAGLLQKHRAFGWQIQLTMPMGRAADLPDLILQPYQIMELIETLADIKWRSMAAAARGDAPVLDVRAADDIGYYGPYEGLLRSGPWAPQSFWMGCHGGVRGIGMEADGVVKPCLSQPTASYAVGSARERPLAELWQEARKACIHDQYTVMDLWGFCRTCEFAATCMAGCPSTSHSTVGRFGNNPFCWHRAASLRSRGLRERLVHAEAAPGGGFDHGRYEIVEEPWPEGDASVAEAYTAK